MARRILDSALGPSGGYPGHHEGLSPGELLAPSDVGRLPGEDTRRRGRAAEWPTTAATFAHDDRDHEVKADEEAIAIAGSPAYFADEEALEPIEIVDELHFEDMVDEGPGAPTPPDLFVVLGDRLEATLRSVAGADAGACAAVRKLLALEPWDRAMPGDRAASCLEGGDIATREGGALVPTPRFTRQVRAWRGVLRGEVDDFGSCGAATLDEWTADLLSRVLGDPSRNPTIRRELRARGVAAFGLVPAS